MSHNVIPANSESIKRKDKIPEYAKDFKREWQYIQGINQKCGEFIHRLNGGDIFNSIPANNIKRHIKSFLKAQERGRLKDISGFYFEYFDASNFECLLEQMDEFYDLYLDPNCFEFIDRHFPGYREFVELISLINDKIEKEDPIFKNNIDSDSDSDSDSD